MAKRQLPPQAVLLQLLRVDVDAGLLFWLRRSPEMFKAGKYSAERKAATWNAHFADKQAFTSLDTHGYRHGSVCGHLRLAHRVIWKMVTGIEPDQIDHINGIRSDNRIVNLRDVSLTENGRNRMTKNPSGVHGVRFDARNGRWFANNGDLRRIGSFNTMEEAIKARLNWQEENGFHPNHGRKTAL